MSVARSTKAFCGTAEGSGQSISNNATQTGTEVDVLGDDASSGEIELFVQIVSTVTAGTVDITVNKRRVTGQAYTRVNPTFSPAPTNGTQLLWLGRVPVSRYMSVDVKNNATGASATVFVGGELFKYS